MAELPPPQPQRRLDTVGLEGIDDLVDADSPYRSAVKSREFPEFSGLDVCPSNIKVVLFDDNSIDSFAACFAARSALGESARYEGVNRGGMVEDLTCDVSGRVVAMLGMSWSLEAMHDLVVECDWLIILETQPSIAKELEQFCYPGTVRILEPDMGAGALAWNLFFPGHPVPPLLRALEDAELGREALRNSRFFADGFHAAFGFVIPHGELSSKDPAFEEFAFCLEEGGRTTIQRAVEEGFSLAGGIQAQCHDAQARRVIQQLRVFPSWLCSLVNSSSPFAGRIAEHLVTALAAGEVNGVPRGPIRCLAGVFEVQRHRVRVAMRSLPGGPDLSELAAMYEGIGRPTRAVINLPIEAWGDIWELPEPIVWDVVPSSPHCLELKRGDLVTIARRGERFRESCFDEWSWGHRSDDASREGWIPTLAHTLLVATQSIPSTGAGILGLDEGEMLVAYGQRGNYLWGSKFIQGNVGKGPKGWLDRKSVV